MNQVELIKRILGNGFGVAPTDKQADKIWAEICGKLTDLACADAVEQRPEFVLSETWIEVTNAVGQYLVGEDWPENSDIEPIKSQREKFFANGTNKLMELGIS